MVMRQSAVLQAPPWRGQEIITAPVPAPVGGLNDRDSYAAMNEKDAIIMDNYFPLPSRVILRNGYTNWVTGISGQVESIMPYRPQSGTAKLFFAAGTSFFDGTNSGAVGAAVLTGLTNARWQHVNFATSGGSFLLNVNGTDKLRGFDGTNWWTDGDGAHDITGLDTTTVKTINVFKKRVWLIVPTTATAWYLPTSSIAGAAQQLPLGSIFSRGGKLVCMVNWTLDAGAGLDDYAAFVSDQGEVAVYQGSDPASATTWALQGVYWIGSPISDRPSCQYAGDALLIGKDGLIPLSKALMSSRVSTNIALTDKIQNAIGDATKNYGSTFGWQVIQYPAENMVILNVPVAIGAQQQYVMNTITGAWCRFKGWAANCFALFSDQLYMGMNGILAKAWSGRSDAGSNINGEVQQAFNYFLQYLPASTLKEFTLAQPLIAIDVNTGFRFGINTDFDLTPPTGVPTFSQVTTTTWDTGLWDTGMWGGDPVVRKNWQTVFGTGYCAGLHILSATNTGRIEWSATNFAFKKGGVL